MQTSIYYMGPSLRGDRIHPPADQLRQCRCLWAAPGVQDEPGGGPGGPGRPTGRPEAPAVGAGGGEGPAGQGGGLAGHHPGQGHRQKGEVLGFPLVPHQLHV